MRHSFFASAVAPLVATVVLGQSASAEVKLSPMFSDQMVLQRDLPAPVWGTAAAGEAVTVSLGDQAQRADADAAGKWSLKLGPLQAGGPFELKVQGTNLVVLRDVLVGDVWVGSGQSNMAGQVKNYAKGDPTLAKLAEATYPKLRLKNNPTAPWREADAAANADFSAILFAFGVKLQQDLDVPVGLMVGAAGGTPSGYWLSPEAYESDAACRECVARAVARSTPEQAQQNHEAALAKWREAVAQWEADVASLKAKGETKLPRKPESPLKPGECRSKVGHLYAAHIKPFIPFAIRGVLWDQGESGTAIQDVNQTALMGALIRGWRADWGQGEFPFIYVQKPSGGGCAWESNDPVTMNAEKLATLPAKQPPIDDGLYRETHIRIMQVPNTAMATSTDLGSGIHPTNKSGYGARAARVALGMAYGKPVEIYGPVYQSHAIEGTKVRVKFTHVGAGLAPGQSDKLQGFAIAGDDRVFHWADATIEGDTVVVSSPAVSHPAAVRYAWSKSSPWANLFNKDGLPALTFRTDSW